MRLRTCLKTRIRLFLSEEKNETEGGLPFFSGPHLIVGITQDGPLLTLDLGCMYTRLDAYNSVNRGAWLHPSEVSEGKLQ